MQQQSTKSFNKLLFSILVATTLLAALSSFNTFYLERDYDFYIEGYKLSAADFDTCEDESCPEACESGTLECEVVEEE